MNNIIELLNLKEKDVENFDVINEKDNSTSFYIKLKRKIEYCPNCGSMNITVKEYKTKKIKHPILNGVKCNIVYKCRRYKCKLCGKTFCEENSFVDKNSNISKYTKVRILDMLKRPKNTFTSIAQECNVSPTKVIEIFDSLGNIKRNKLSKVICLDEYYDPSTGIGKYNLVILDFQKDEIIDILPDRTKYYIQHYLQRFSKEELEIVEHISIDMWEPYKAIAKVYFKNAKISVDPFHVMKHVNNALDKVRLAVMRKYNKNSDEYYLLKKFSYLLFKNYNDIKYYEPKLNRRLGRYLNNESTLELILQIDSTLNFAYDLKERYHRFNTTFKSQDKQDELKEIISFCKQSQNEHLITLSKTLNHWYQEILNSFTFINGKRITNGLIESKNSLIRVLTSNANGCTNFRRERNRIMYCFNKNVIFEETKIPIKRNLKSRGNYKSK